MKKMMLTLIAVFAIAMSSKAMSYEQARNEALFLTDKMAYELNLTDAQYEAAYEINLDYLMGVTSRHDVFGSYWERRNLDLQYILYTWQWEAFRAATYFYRPLYWSAGYWHFGVYARYPHRDYFYFGRPHFYVSYRGGHSWRMNGGHSYYEHHRHHYSPSIAREHHSGMRDGWNRGDYRNHHDNSSTRITGSRNHDHNRPMGVGNAASGNNTRHGEAGHSESAGHDHNRPFGAGNAATGSSTTSRSENSRISTTGVPNHNQSNRNLRNHNMQNRSAASQMQRSSGFSSPSRSAGVSSPTRSAGVSSPTRSAGVSSPTRSAGMSTSGSRSSVSSHSSSHSSGGATRGGGGGRSGGRR